MSYFHKAIVKRMLRPDAEERPSFIELRDIMRLPQIELNLDNEAYVEGVLRERIRKQMVESGKISES